MLNAQILEMVKSPSCSAFNCLQLFNLYSPLHLATETKDIAVKLRHELDTVHYIKLLNAAILLRRIQ
jgi:hypothetical protein